MVGGTDAFSIVLPSDEDLDVATEAWVKGHSRIELAQGTVWYRVISADSLVDARRFACTCYASTQLCRFTPLRRDGVIVAAAYAATTEETALLEVVLRDIRHAGVRRVPVAATRDRYLCEVELSRPIRALDICRPRDALLIANGKRPPDLTAAWPAAYGVTRYWAQALFNRLSDVEAISYESHQVAGRCAVFFPPDDEPLFDLRGSPMVVTEDPVRAAVAGLARRAGAIVDFGDDEDD